MNAIDQQLHQLEIDLEWELLWSIPDTDASSGSGLQRRVELLRTKAGLVKEGEQLIERFNAINLSNFPIDEKQGKLREQITRAQEIQKKFAEGQNGVGESLKIKSFSESLTSNFAKSIASVETLVSQFAEIEKQASQCEQELKQLAELKDKSKQALFLEPKVYHAFAKLALLKQQFPEASPVIACEETALDITEELNLNESDRDVFAAEPQATWVRHILKGPVDNDADLQTWLTQLEIALRYLESQGQDWEQITVADNTLAIIKDLQQKTASEYFRHNYNRNHPESILAFSRLIRWEQLYRQLTQVQVTVDEKSVDQILVNNNFVTVELKDIQDSNVLLKWLKRQDDLEVAQRQAVNLITQIAEDRAFRAVHVAKAQADKAKKAKITAAFHIKKGKEANNIAKKAQEQAAEARRQANQAAEREKEADQARQTAEREAEQAKREADAAKKQAGPTWARNMLRQPPQNLDFERSWAFYITAVSLLSLLNETEPLLTREQAEVTKPADEYPPEKTETNVKVTPDALVPTNSLEEEAN